jgi:hypothetical protein
MAVVVLLLLPPLFPGACPDMPLSHTHLPPPSPPLHTQIHWFSIVNSCVTVLLLTGFLATILMRVLKNDFIKYTNSSRDDEALEDNEETGWKVGRPGQGRETAACSLQPLPNSG